MRGPTVLSKLSQLLQGEWWKSMFGVLLRTLIAGIVPFMLAYVNGQPIAWYAAISQIGLLLVAAILTSLAGIPIPGTAPYWEILLARFLRQLAQFMIAGVGTAILFSDVDWKTLVVGAVASALSTVLLGSLVVVPSSPVIITGEVVSTPVVNVYNPTVSTASDMVAKHAVIEDPPVGI
jgi:hypothetical protein